MLDVLLGYGRTQAGVLVNTIISREFFITCFDVDVYRERRWDWVEGGGWQDEEAA
jgi:hypothetical protein